MQHLQPSNYFTGLFDNLHRPNLTSQKVLAHQQEPHQLEDRTPQREVEEDNKETQKGELTCL